MNDFIFPLSMALGFVIVIGMIFAGNRDRILDAAWGPRRYSYEKLGISDALLIEPNEFLGDEYMINWQIYELISFRDAGPKWASKVKHVKFTADWDCDEGISIGEQYVRHMGSFAIQDPDDWRLEACDELMAWVNAKRKANNFKPPVDQITINQLTDEGLVVKGHLYMGGLIQPLSVLKPRVARDAKGRFMKLPSKDSAILTIGEGTDVDSNEELKSMYTLEELAQQAINRDNES